MMKTARDAHAQKYKKKKTEKETLLRAEKRKGERDMQWGAAVKNSNNNQKQKNNDTVLQAILLLKSCLRAALQPKIPFMERFGCMHALHITQLTHCYGRGRKGHTQSFTNNLP